MHEVVKYNNKLNMITFKNFLAMDCNYFMYLCFRLKELGESTIQVRFQDIREAVNLRNISNEELEESLFALNDKLLATTGRIKDGSITRQFTLFNDFETDSKEQVLTISVNPKYAYILNDFSDGFTRFEFQEFMLLSGKHTKAIYRLLKQWRTQGQYTVSLEDLKRFTDCADMETRYFMRDVVKKAVKEMTEKGCFQDLEVASSRGKKLGGPLDTLTFTFTPEKAKRATTPSKSTPSKDSKPKATQHRGMEREYDYEELEKRLAGL